MDDKEEGHDHTPTNSEDEGHSPTHSDDEGHSPTHSDDEEAKWQTTIIIKKL